MILQRFETVDITLSKVGLRLHTLQILLWCPEACVIVQSDHVCYFSFHANTLRTLWKLQALDPTDHLVPASDWHFPSHQRKELSGLAASTPHSRSSSSYTRWAPHQPSLIGDMVPEAEGDLWPCKFCLDVHCVPDKKETGFIKWDIFIANCNDLIRTICLHYYKIHFLFFHFDTNYTWCIGSMHDWSRNNLNSVHVKIELRRIMECWVDMTKFKLANPCQNMKGRKQKKTLQKYFKRNANVMSSSTYVSLFWNMALPSLNLVISA